ncbi:MAG: hypothetical protein Q7T60_06095 [Sphingopyxis sp.]|nr:hypothetical protein [Sphingopyxis sp.]
MAMRLFGGAFGWASAIFPIVYIGGFLWYFLKFSGGSADGLAASGLGPTVIGLAVVGLLLSMPLLIKLLRLVTSANRVPGASIAAMGDTLPDTEGFDADAAFASYMSKRPETPPLIETIPLAPVAPRPQFGRRGT